MERRTKAMGGTKERRAFDADFIRRRAKRTPKETLMRYVLVIFGTFFVAAAYNLFFSPANMVPGGFTGLAIVLRGIIRRNFGIDVPTWLGSLILNAPALVAMFLVRGRRFAVKTATAALLLSLWLYLLPERGFVPDDLLLTALFGGVLSGLGGGLTFLAEATTGGTDAVAAVVKKFVPSASTPAILTILDAVVIGLAAATFGIVPSAYAVIAAVVVGSTSDRILSGARNAYVATIVTEKAEEMETAISENLNRGATETPAIGAYTKDSKTMLTCAVSKRQIAELKEIVRETDEDAFLMICDAREVRGKGFLKNKGNEL